MNLAHQLTIPGVSVIPATKWDYARAQEAHRILHDRSRIAAAVRDVMPDDEAAWGFILLHAAEVMSTHGDDSLKQMLHAAANEAATYVDVAP